MICIPICPAACSPGTLTPPAPILDRRVKTFLALFSTGVCQSSFSSVSVEIIGDSEDGSRKQLQIQDEYVMFGSQDRPSRWFNEKRVCGRFLLSLVVHAVSTCDQGQSRTSIEARSTFGVTTSHLHFQTVEDVFAVIALNFSLEMSQSMFL
jgi:hypothetical protein